MWKLAVAQSAPALLLSYEARPAGQATSQYLSPALPFSTAYAVATVNSPSTQTKTNMGMFDHLKLPPPPKDRSLRGWFEWKVGAVHCAGQAEACIHVWHWRTPASGQNTHRTAVTVGTLQQ